ncbi:hypothetical protein EC991_000354 [Linnemannia zychae]|nr:hypothetical protein EC991_000354 [Linnemannia zychae]
MASWLSNDHDMAASQSEYSYPISNITYHLPDSPHPGQHDAVAKKAFQRIMDNYDENERLADAFQVELDKRKQLADKRKAEERRIRAERQLQLREEKRIKKLGKNHKATTTSSSTLSTPPPQQQQQQPSATAMSVATLAQALQPRHGRYAAAGYSLMGLEREREHRRSIDISGQRSRQSSEGSLHSAIGGLYGAESAHEGETRMVESRLSLASDHPSPHSPLLLHAPFHPADRSLSNSPVLPLTPSPHLKPSDTAFGVVAPFSTVATTTASLPTSSAATTSGQLDTSMSSSSATATSPTSAPFTSNTSLPTPPPQSRTSSTLPMRNKRKQAIPVHPSVIKRIPGITFRIQPDLDHHLQVEILKNIDDYQSTSLKVTQGVSVSGHSIPQRTDTDKPNDASQLQANQDLSKVRQSITSSRPGYASLFIPDDSATYEDPYLQDYRETSPRTMALHVAPNNGNSSSNNSRHHPYQRHARNGSLGNGHALNILTPNNPRSRSNSSANIWAPYAPSPAGLAMLLSDVVAARATLPLSWDNFSTRDCQVNKVVGKNGRDFEQLEAVVQETVARHQAVAAVAAAAAQEEANQENREDEQAEVSMTLKQEQKSSSAAATAAAKSSSGSTADASKKRKSVSATTPPPPSHALAQQVAGSRSTRSRTTHAAEGARRSSRGAATGLVEGYDDIERILKEKRQKKREQRKQRDSQSRGVSEATTEGDYDVDVDMEQPRIKEDVDTDDRSALLRGYTESGAYSETHPRRSTTKPPSPPHSRQVTPAAKIDLGGSSIHPHQQHAHLGSGSSRTPPATPTRASARHSQLTTPDAAHHDAAAESTGVSGGRTRARARSFSSTIPTDAKTNFFESALEMIEAKRRQSIAKKKASAATASLTTASTPDTQQDHLPNEQQRANRQLEQEIANETSQKMDPNSNIPKSSKLLPGRVLRKPRVKTHDGQEQDSVSEKGALGHDQDGDPKSAVSGPGEPTFDPDCSSCRLDISDVDLTLWKQARMSGEIHLNPKTWGRTAILCSSCRVQYLRHGLRCTQCFYVPVWNPESALAATSEAPEGSNSTASTPATSTSVMPKPGGTCKRCKAGTWLQEA